MGHLDPPDPAGLPRQRRGRTPQMHGRFPDYDVMEQAGHWDDVTRELVQKREREVPEIRFFDAGEARSLGAFLDVALAQDAEPRIPVLNMVDAKLQAGELDGFRFEDMPEDTETWRLVARGLDETGRDRGGDDFASVPLDIRKEIVHDFSSGELGGGTWERLNVSRAWSVVMRAALATFYSHPWAWNEIGFGGPAYPRGYMRRNMGPSGRDPGEPLEAFGLDPVEDVQRRSEA
ncbi:MAG TPA: gluconate 2-dehydrogenase subunit 3 family protein [Thermoleophilaceae bacterium]|nr:gluconate 2-dehydrogenase subunit 3 family protein [Thermoleophilaceae bacterium]